VRPLWRQVRALLWKDVLVESRGRETVLTGIVFALLVLVVFSLAFDLRVENAAVVAPGVLWVTFLFAATLALGRSFARERDRGTLDGLLLAPMDRAALYVSKVVANVLAIGVVELIVLPVYVALFGVHVDPWALLATVALGTLGIAGVGTLFAAIAAHTRARDVLLPVLLLPVQVPVVLATVKSTAAAIQVPGGEPSDGANWLGLLVAFDGLFLGLSLLLFDAAVEQD
jgi:heme exporter protein B